MLVSRCWLKYRRIVLTIKRWNKLVLSLKNLILKNWCIVKVLESRTDTNEAIQIFSRFVIKNKDKFQHEKDFYQLLRAYLNILLWAEKKTEVKKILDSFDGLRHEIKNTIVEKSKMGKFVGIARTLRRKNTKYRKEFLDLIETFTSTNQYDELLEKLKMFVTKTRSGNTATLTGIISALQPDHFMVYNQRSSLPLRDTIYKDFTDVKMSRYWDFNTIYRKDFTKYWKKSSGAWTLLPTIDIGIIAIVIKIK